MSSDGILSIVTSHLPPPSPRCRNASLPRERASERPDAGGLQGSVVLVRSWNVSVLSARHGWIASPAHRQGSAVSECDDSIAIVLANLFASHGRGKYDMFALTG